MLFVPRLGIEVDEAIVTSGIFDHGNPWYSWKFDGSELPIMLLSYLGALKAWLYNGLFLFIAPRPIALRLPMLLLAAGTLWLFFELLDRTMGRKAAWIGTLLLATDTSYLLLNTADYGPVTLQFVFKLAALLLLVRFHKTDRKRNWRGRLPCSVWPCGTKPSSLGCCSGWRRRRGSLPSISGSISAATNVLVAWGDASWRAAAGDL
jgi:hypothetical protein